MAGVGSGDVVVVGVGPKGFGPFVADANPSCGPFTGDHRFGHGDA